MQTVIAKLSKIFGQKIYGKVGGIENERKHR